ncbi:MAG TPA: hypothetical protein VFB62_26150 [Polyangiaceae bacterium]|jgi:hypothetical protein|nr:hypothetical protein [Polyangiaceae bacterium]
MLHRFIFFIGTVAVVAVACTVDKTSGGDDDDTGSTSSNATSSSTGPGLTDTCEEQCEAMHPAGVTDYTNVRLCMVCWACGDRCKEDHSTSVCVDGVGQAPEGCSAQAPTCGECIASECALTATFGGVCGPIASVCAANMECVLMNKCVSDCVAAGMTTSSSSTTSAVSSSATGG